MSENQDTTQADDAANATAATDERREHDRKDYGGEAYVAPFDGEDLPNDASFTRVSCNDVSSASIGFYWPTQPTFKKVAIKLDCGSGTVAVAAEVARCVPDGQSRFLLGCKLLSRLSE